MLYKLHAVCKELPTGPYGYLIWHYWAIGKADILYSSTTATGLSICKPLIKPYVLFAGSRSLLWPLEAGAFLTEVNRSLAQQPGAKVWGRYSIVQTHPRSLLLWPHEREEMVLQERPLADNITDAYYASESNMPQGNVTL